MGLERPPQASVTLANGANVMSPPLKLVAGATYKLVVIQPKTGASGTITWPDPPFRFPGHVTPTLSTANTALDILWFMSDGANMFLCVEALNLS